MTEPLPSRAVLSFLDGDIVPLVSDYVRSLSCCERAPNSGDKFKGK